MLLSALRSTSRKSMLDRMRRTASQHFSIKSSPSLSYANPRDVTSIADAAPDKPSMQITAISSPSSAKCFLSRSTELSVSPTPKPSTSKLPDATCSPILNFLGETYTQSPISVIIICDGCSPKATASSACFCKCLCSPCTGIKYCGFNSA